MSASSNQVPNKSVVAFAWCSDMAKQVSLTYQRIQLVLRAKSDKFCRCEDGNCGGESCDCSRSFTIPNDCVKQVAGTYYVKLSRKNVSVRRLMCCFAHASDESNEGYLLQVLGKVSVVDDLVAERNIAVAMAACNCSRERAAKLHPRWREWKKHRASLANIPEVLEITSPQIGDVPCCQLKILASNLKSTGHPCVMMEFTDESLGWLANAIDWQFRQGGCTSRYATSKQETRTKKKQKEKKGTAQQGDHPAEEAEGAKADGTDTVVPIKNRMVPVENQEQGRSRPTRARRATTTTRSRRRKRNHRLLLQVQSHRPDRLWNFCRQSFSTHRWLHRRARVQHRVRMSPHKSN